MASKSVSGAVKTAKSPPPKAQRTPVSTIPATAAAKDVGTSSAKTSGKVSHVPTSKSTPHTELPHLTSPVDARRTSPRFAGELGSIVEYQSASWKVAYRGPVFFSDEDHLGLVATTAVLTSSDQPFPGNCNGTVDGTTYFICEEGRGLMVPTRAVLGNPPGPSEQDDGDNSELSGSITGLVIGPQSIRRLKAEVSEERFQHHRPAPQGDEATPQCRERLLVAHVGVQVDALPAVDESISVHRPISCSRLIADDPATIRDLSEASAALSSAIARWRRTIDPLVAEEDQWISDVTQSTAALHPGFAWSDVLNRCPQLKARLDAAAKAVSCDSGVAGRARYELVFDAGKVNVQHSRLRTALQKFCLPQMDIPVSDGDRPVLPIVRQTTEDSSQARVEALRQALTPLITYAALPQVAIVPDVLESTDVATLRRLGSEQAGSEVAVVLANDCDAQETERRILFEIESICQDAAAAAGEGRVEQLETLGHLRVDAAQKLQQSCAGVLDSFGPLQKHFVDALREALRDAIKECDAALAQQLDSVANDDIRIASARVAELQASAESLQDAFIRNMFHNNTDVASARQEVSALHEREKLVLEELNAAFAEWDSVRCRKLVAMRHLQHLSEERRRAFDAHHEAAATIALHKLEQQCACDWANSVHDRIEEFRNALIPELLEKETASLMHLQRLLFERQTAAHDRHQQSFRHVCLAAEELAFRKEQAHRLICDRLDRCNMEVELAQDSLDSRCGGLVREARELDRVAREMFDDITAIRCVVKASQVVFQEKSAPLLIQCGKLGEDPVVEAKRLCDEKRHKLLTITQRLQSE